MDRGGRSPRKRIREHDVTRNRHHEKLNQEEPHRALRSDNSDDCAQQNVWSAKRDKEPTGPTVAGVSEVQAGDYGEQEHDQRKTIGPPDFAPEFEGRLRAGLFK